MIYILLAIAIGVLLLCCACRGILLYRKKITGEGDNETENSSILREGTPLTHRGRVNSFSINSKHSGNYLTRDLNINGSPARERSQHSTNNQRERPPTPTRLEVVLAGDPGELKASLSIHSDHESGEFKASLSIHTGSEHSGEFKDHLPFENEGKEADERGRLIEPHIIRSDEMGSSTRITSFPALPPTNIYETTPTPSINSQSSRSREEEEEKQIILPPNGDRKGVGLFSTGHRAQLRYSKVALSSTWPRTITQTSHPTTESTSLSSRPESHPSLVEQRDAHNIDDVEEEEEEKKEEDVGFDVVTSDRASSMGLTDTGRTSIPNTRSVGDETWNPLSHGTTLTGSARDTGTHAGDM